jgi:hypothetical protein
MTTPFLEFNVSKLTQKNWLTTHSSVFMQVIALTAAEACMLLVRPVKVLHQTTKEQICALNADANVQKLNQSRAVSALAQHVKEKNNGS